MAHAFGHVTSARRITSCLAVQSITTLHQAPERVPTADQSVDRSRRQFLLVERHVAGHKRRMNLYRTCTVSVEGLLVSGPILHLAYTWMDANMGGDDVHWISTILQVLFDLIVVDATLTATLMITSALLQGRWHDVVREMRCEYLPALYVSTLSSGLLAPVQFLNFRYVPVQFRVLITNLEDVLWNAAVSHMAHRSRH